MRLRAAVRMPLLFAVLASHAFHKNAVDAQKCCRFWGTGYRLHAYGCDVGATSNAREDKCCAAGGKAYCVCKFDNKVDQDTMFGICCGYVYRSDAAPTVPF